MTKEEKEKMLKEFIDRLEDVNENGLSQEEASKADEVNDEVQFYHDVIGRLFCELTKDYKDNDEGFAMKPYLFSVACIRCAHTMLSMITTDKLGSKSETAKGIMQMIIDIIPD